MGTIDGEELSTMGLGIVKDSYSSLFRYPKRKDVRYTDYAERDGIKADLHRFETVARDVTLHFSMRHDSQSEFLKRYEEFYAFITAPGYRTVDFGTGFTHRLRYEGTQSYDPYGVMGKGCTLFSMNFKEDDLFIDSSVYYPYSEKVRIPAGEYRINNIDFYHFGVSCTVGQRGKVLSYPSSKSPFTDGKRVYVEDVLRMKQKTISLPLCMCCKDVKYFNRNYQAFFNFFAQPGVLYLQAKALGDYIGVYYKDCTSYRLYNGMNRSAVFNIVLGSAEIEN
jgi:hypothetical protein